MRARGTRSSYGIASPPVRDDGSTLRASGGSTWAVTCRFTRPPSSSKPMSRARREGHLSDAPRCSAARSWMAALASWPQPLPGVRATARTLGATPGGVSLALKRLVAARYLTSDHRATSELFWAAAAEWRPDWVELPLGSLPPGFDAVAVGALAAFKLGAPVAVSVDAKPEYLVSSDAALRYAALSMKTRSPTEPAARYSVAPAAIAIEQRDPTGETVNDVFVASSAIVALSLAIDPARGAETVRSWEGDHVWN